MRALLFIFLLVFLNASANENIEGILKKYSQSKVKFKQKTYIKDINETQEFEGYIYIKKPDIKVEYITPYKQIIFIKNGKIYIYSPEENQVIITEQSQNLLILDTAKILSGEKPVGEVFNIKKLSKNIYILTPKISKEVKYIKLYLSNGLISKIEIIDKEKNKVIIEFLKSEFSKDLKINLNLPNNVEVINYTN